MRTAAAALAALALALPAAGATAQPAKTTGARAFTSEWTCANGRTLLVNAHPRRPREVSHITYLGNRVALRPAGAAKERRHASADGKVVWQYDGDDHGRLSFAGLLEQPLVCTRNPKTTTKK
jgi:hypothetical protein